MGYFILNQTHDRVFCFCCKIFVGNNSQFTIVGYCPSKHLSENIKSTNKVLITLEITIAKVLICKINHIKWSKIKVPATVSYRGLQNQLKKLSRLSSAVYQSFMIIWKLLSNSKIFNIDFLPLLKDDSTTVTVKDFIVVALNNGEEIKVISEYPISVIKGKIFFYDFSQITSK